MVHSISYPLFGIEADPMLSVAAFFSMIKVLHDLLLPDFPVDLESHSPDLVLLVAGLDQVDHAAGGLWDASVIFTPPPKPYLQVKIKHCSLAKN